MFCFPLPTSSGKSTIRYLRKVLDWKGESICSADTDMHCSAWSQSLPPRKHMCRGRNHNSSASLFGHGSKVHEEMGRNLFRETVKLTIQETNTTVSIQQLSWLAASIHKHAPLLQLIKWIKDFQPCTFRETHRFWQGHLSKLYMLTKWGVSVADIHGDPVYHP